MTRRFCKWRGWLRIRTAILALCCSLIFSSVPSCGSAGSSDANLEVGNFWEYSFNVPIDTLMMSGNLRMEIDGVDDVLVSGTPQDAFVVRFTGTGAITGIYFSEEVTGVATIHGLDMRLCSNFDLVWSTAEIDINVTLLDSSVSMDMGYDLRYFPPLDDYLGDDNPSPDTYVTTDTHATGETWQQAFGSESYEEVDDYYELTMNVLEVDQLISTPAGIFTCYKVRMAETRMDKVSVSYNYYSVRAGNYVKMDAQSAYLGGLLGVLTLVSYSYNPDGTPPEADAGTDITVDVGDLVEFDGSGSTDNIGIVNYTWEFTEGGSVKRLYGPDPEHTFNAKGEYLVNLTVYDKCGNSDSDTMTVTVRDLGILNYFIGDENWVGMIIIGAAAAGIAALAVSSAMKRRRRKALSESVKRIRAARLMANWKPPKSPPPLDPPE
ncbi:PKD domain-containing protein [Candidatus Bathyarchaeota archaeon]|nr:PKD domain-containing protein [Candidatus Bathyarchaeota archaeon]